MRNFFDSAAWNTFFLMILGIISIITKEIVTFVMLGIILLSLTNIYTILKEISNKLDNIKK